MLMKSKYIQNVIYCHQHTKFNKNCPSRTQDTAYWMQKMQIKWTHFNKKVRFFSNNDKIDNQSTVWCQCGCILQAGQIS